MPLSLGALPQPAGLSFLPSGDYMGHENPGLGCPSWKSMRGEPTGCYNGTRGVILAKEVELSSLGTAVVTGAPVEVVMMGDGLVGEVVGGW